METVAPVVGLISKTDPDVLFAAAEATCKMARLVITYNNPATAPPQAHSYNFQPFFP